MEAMSRYLLTLTKQKTNRQFMTDKERIERLVLTLMHLNNALQHLDQMACEPEVKESIQDIRKTISDVIDINANEVKLDLWQPSP